MTVRPGAAGMFVRVRFVIQGSLSGEFALDREPVLVHLFQDEATVGDDLLIRSQAGVVLRGCLHDDPVAGLLADEDIPTLESAGPTRARFLDENEIESV